MMFESTLYISLCLLAQLPLLTFLLVWLLRPARPSGRVRTALVLGSGGHTAELLKLVRSLDPFIYSPRTYYLATTDMLGKEKVKEVEGRLGQRRDYVDTGDYSLIRIPRAREVGQSFLTSVITTAWSFLLCWPSILKDQPQLLLVNGPGTCVPIVLIARILSVFSPCRIVYIESVCRVSSLSLTARLVLPLADSVLVQWPELVMRYPGTQYIGRFL